MASRPPTSQFINQMANRPQQAPQSLSFGGPQKPMMQQPQQQPMISDMRYRGPQQQQTSMQQIGNLLRQQPFTQPQPMISRGPVNPQPQQPTAGLGAAFNQFNAQQAMGRMVQPPQQAMKPMTQPPPPPSQPLTPPQAPQGYNAGQQYQDFGQKLAGMIQSGQLTPQRANELKSSVYEATRLGNTPEGQAAMQKALAASTGQLPMQGYNAGQQYQAFGQELAGMIQSGKLTPQQANALKNSVYEASRLGNTNAGYEAMQKALTSARGQMGVGFNDGGYVGMAPPNPYAQQVGQEDPRMQAMRNMQMMNFGG